MVKGEAAMRLDVWRHWLRLENEAKHRRMLEALEKLHNDENVERACQMLKQFMIRMVKGEMAMRLDVWRYGLKRWNDLKYQRMLKVCPPTASEI